MMVTVGTQCSYELDDLSGLSHNKNQVSGGHAISLGTSCGWIAGKNLNMIAK